MKKCSTCRCLLPPERKARLCALCARAYLAEYRRKNRETLSAKAQAKYWANPEKARADKVASTKRHLEATRARSNKWHKENAAKRNAYREKNRDRYRETWREWWKANPEKARARALRSKAVRRQNEKRAGNQCFGRKEVFERDGGRCRYCAAELRAGWHVDHIIPLSKGGLHTLENVVVSCAACNLSKGTKAKTPRQIDSALVALATGRTE